MSLTNPPGPPPFRDVFEEAVRLHMAGQFGEAERLYKQIPADDLYFADSLDLLGVMAYQVGRHDMAVDRLERAIAMKPGHPNYHCHMGVALKSLGKLDEALASFDRAIALDPAFAEAHNSRAVALQAMGRLDQAVDGYTTAVALKPDFAEAHNNRGVVLAARGKLAEALASYDSALAARPDYVEAHNNRGIAFTRLARWHEAIASYDQAIALRPGYAEAHNNRGNALRGAQRLDEAVASYHRALSCDPNSCDALYNLAIAMTTLHKPREAIALLDRVLSSRPDYAEAYAVRGTALMNSRRLEEAVASFDLAIARSPAPAQVHMNRGIALGGLGRMADARASFEQARTIEPESFDYVSMATLLLPVILRSAAEIPSLRQRYREGIAALMDLAAPSKPVEELNIPSVFHLAYHDVDDRQVLEDLCTVYRSKVPGLTYETPYLRAWRPPGRERPVRIGFLSEFFREHTIEKLYRGLIRNLDRSRFEVVLFHCSSANAEGAAPERVDPAARSIRLEPSLARQRQMIAEEHLDMLFYPDIGMSREAYLLAFSRLAPVQAVGWGHPNTTGLDTIDYFVSARAAEPPEGDLHYSERLVGLDRLPCFYEPPVIAGDVPTRADLGLPESGTLYGCPQSLFKFHPDFDPILADIAAGDPQGHIVVLEGRYPAWGDLLRQRWSRSHPVLVERVRFLPRVPIELFMALMAHFDVLLDPIHFGSGNTLYEAMARGTPIVTWPGRFMRGRIVAAAYRQMGLVGAPVARSQADYAPLALALGRDPLRRHALRTAAHAAAGALFEDRQAIGDFETFIRAAVEAAARNEKLPPGWRPEGRQSTPT